MTAISKDEMIFWAGVACRAINAPAEFELLEVNEIPVMIVITVDDEADPISLEQVVMQFNETAKIGPDANGRFIPVIITNKQISIKAKIAPDKTEEKRPELV